MKPAPDGTLGSVLRQVDHDIFAVDLREAPAEGPIADWLDTPMPVRSIGAGFSSLREGAYFRTVTPRAAWDVVVFVENTTAARPNPRSRARFEMDDAEE